MPDLQKVGVAGSLLRAARQLPKTGESGGVRRAGAGSGLLRDRRHRRAESEAPAPPLRSHRLGPAGPRVPDRGRPRSAPRAPQQPPPRLPLLPRPRLPGLAPTACPPVSAGPSVCPLARRSAAPVLLTRVRVDLSVPAATNLSPDSAPPASATLGRGLAGRVGRAAADGAGIKRRQRKQLVSACPEPDPWSR